MMNEIITHENQIEAILGFKLKPESITRIKELKLKAGFPDFEGLFASCLGTLEIFLKERLKNRVFVTLSESYISDFENWDKKVWLFDIDFLKKDVEVHIRNLEVLQRSRFDKPDYDFDEIKKLLGKENYEEIMVNSIVLIEWIVTEIDEVRIIGSVDQNEFENMVSSNWRILVLYTTKNDLSDYRHSWDI